jgi:uncharacterized membrane protein YidH (DUF202 family)
MSATSFDEGLQPERTALAWRRTGLVGAVAAIALARAAITRGSVVIAVMCVAIVVVAAATLFEGTRELGARVAAEDGSLPAPTVPVAARATVAVVTLLAVIGFVLVVVE